MKNKCRVLGVRYQKLDAIPVEFCSERDGRVSIKLGGLGGG